MTTQQADLITQPIELTTAPAGLEITTNRTLTEEMFPPGLTGEASAESIQTTVASQTTGGEITEEPEAVTPVNNGATNENVPETGSQPTTISPPAEATQVDEGSTPSEGKLTCF